MRSRSSLGSDLAPFSWVTVSRCRCKTLIQSHQTEVSMSETALNAACVLLVILCFLNGHLFVSYSITFSLNLAVPSFFFQYFLAAW